MNGITQGECVEWIIQLTEDGIVWNTKNVRGNIKERNVYEKDKVGMIIDVFSNKQHNGGFLLLEMSWKMIPRGGKELGIGNGVEAHQFNKVGKALCEERIVSPNT